MTQATLKVSGTPLLVVLSGMWSIISICVIHHTQTYNDMQKTQNSWKEIGEAVGWFQEDMMAKFFLPPSSVAIRNKLKKEILRKS